MQKYLSVILPILFLWISSCDHEESVRSEAIDYKKITLTDLDHEPVVKDLLAKIHNRATNGRISTLEIADAFFKYEDSDSGILNYTLRLPDDSPDYFENLILSQYEDGFYGFIYRYIPDDIYSVRGEFKGILQLYNLENELIQELRIPFEAGSVYAGGRTQLVSPCIKGVEQNCVTTYEVKTVTDYPCHCQYESKTKVGKVCTVSLKKGWCDETVAAPPAGGGGTFVSVPGEEPHGGGGGGKTPPKKNPVVLLQDDGYDDINYDKVKSPCLVNVIKNLLREDFKNRINQDAKNLFIDAEQAQNLNFIEVSAILDSANRPVQAHTSTAYPTMNNAQNVDIELNSSTLPGTSELFQIVAIYHETMHAIFNMNTAYRRLRPNKKHEYMSSLNRTQFMIDAVSEIYNRKLTSEETQKVAAVWLFNFSEARATNNYQESMDKWNLTIDDIFRIGEHEEKVVKVIVNGESKIKSLGGPNCNND